MLPYSTDWFMSWLPNIHSSLFMDIYQYLSKHTSVTGVEALIKSYRLYLEQIEISQGEPELSITRAWFLIRFFEANMLELTVCTECGGHFVTHTDELTKDYVCGICRPPSRAGKTKKAALLEAIAGSEQPNNRRRSSCKSINMCPTVCCIPSPRRISSNCA
jgi:flagellar transcriptional activator FlhC